MLSYQHSIFILYSNYYSLNLTPKPPVSIQFTLLCLFLACSYIALLKQLLELGLEVKSKTYKFIILQSQMILFYLCFYISHSTSHPTILHRLCPWGEVHRSDLWVEPFCKCWRIWLESECIKKKENYVHIMGENIAVFTFPVVWIRVGLIHSRNYIHSSFTFIHGCNFLYGKKHFASHYTTSFEHNGGRSVMVCGPVNTGNHLNLARIKK